MTEWVEPEPVPTGMAAALLASWNRLHYDGQVTFHDQECDFGIGLAQLLSCTGGLTEWATMAAVVQDVTYDIGGGKVTVKTGTCGRLEADNLMAVYRAARGRRFSYLRLGRDSADASDGNQIDGASATPNDSVADGTPACLRKRFAVEAADSGSRVHLVDINPAAIAFATAGNAAAQTLQLREMVMPYMDGSTLKAKLAQVLCGAGYAAEIPLGGTRPADPATPDTVGTNAEGSEAAETTTYNGATATAGLKVWFLSREGFFEGGDKKLYCYMRSMTFPAAIAPTVSAETRVLVDTPQA